MHITLRFFLLCLLTGGIMATSQAQRVNTEPDSLFKPSLSQVDSLRQLLPVVFSNKGCGRCSMAKETLTKDSIPFIVVDLGTAENRSLMYSIAQRAAGDGLKGIHYPVITYKEMTEYGQLNLNEFLTQLADTIKKGKTEAEQIPDMK